MKHLQILLILPLLLLNGCYFRGESTGNVKVGKRSKAEIYQIIYDNITTRSDAIRQFGDPQDEDYDGVTKHRKLTYLHIDRSNLKRNYVPIFNFFSHGTEDIKKKIILVFDEREILVKALVSESCGEHKDGLFD